MDGKMARARRWKHEKFQHNRVSKRLVRKRGEEGLYLYPKRQSEGTWMNSKCQIISKRANLNARLHHLGFES
jgi:hypothetical protein